MISLPSMACRGAGRPRDDHGAFSTDLPRMQNQSRAQAPLGRGLNIVSQVIEKAVKQKGEPKPPMMRQYDLIERVSAITPTPAKPCSIAPTSTP